MNAAGELFCRFGRALARQPLPLLLGLAAFYLYPTIYVPVATGDEAQQADYLRRIVAGQLPFRDFIDIYGPLNWLLPAKWYGWAGHRWIGVRWGMLGLQLLIAALAFQLTRRLGNRFYAVAVFAAITLFFGLPLALNRAPYAFMLISPLTFGVLLLLLPPTSAARTALAGGLTATAMLLKISSGLFLWLAGLWICFYLGKPGRIAYVTPRWPTCGLWLRMLGAVGYLAIMTTFVMPHYGAAYFKQLTLPLTCALALTIYFEWRQARSLNSDEYAGFCRQRGRQWAMYGLSTLAAGGLILSVLWPSGITAAMFDKFPHLLTQISYHHDFWPFGKRPSSTLAAIVYQGGWPYLPLPAIALTAIWLAARWQRGWASFRADWKTEFFSKRLQGSIALWMVAALGHYVIYPTPDLGHLIQDVTIWMALIAVLALHVEVSLAHSRRAIVIWRMCIIIGLICWLRPLYQPSDASLARHADLQQCDTLSSRSSIDDTAVYRQCICELAQWIDQNLSSADDCWILSTDKLIHFYTNRPLYGGHNTFFFYLLSHQRLNRDTFIYMIGPRAWHALLINPPRIIINHDDHGGRYVKQVLPEVAAWIDQHYRSVLLCGQFIVYQRISEPIQ